MEMHVLKYDNGLPFDNILYYGKVYDFIFTYNDHANHPPIFSVHFEWGLAKNHPYKDITKITNSNNQIIYKITTPPIGDYHYTNKELTHSNFLYLHCQIHNNMYQHKILIHPVKESFYFYC